MRQRANAVCTICGVKKTAPNTWFVVVENRWEDTLRVLRWDDELTRTVGAHAACCIAHVQELVLHWMTTSSLNYPFAKPPWLEASLGLPQGAWDLKMEIDTGEARVLGELAVDREAIKRVLNESPHSLISMLGALKTALLDEPVRTPGCETAVPALHETFQDI